MPDLKLRSPSAKIGGLVYFGRMIDKIRAQARGTLPPEYQQNLGRGFDHQCASLLGVNYEALVERVLRGGEDDEFLEWCYSFGRRPTEDDMFVWNEFMRKRGWNDDITETLKRRKKESGMAGRSEIETMFAFIDADEGRPIREPEARA